MTKSILQRPVGGTPAPASAKVVKSYLDRKRPVHLPNIERVNEPVILFVTLCAQRTAN